MLCHFWYAYFFCFQATYHVLSVLSAYLQDALLWEWSLLSDVWSCLSTFGKTTLPPVVINTTAYFFEHIQFSETQNRSSQETQFVFLTVIMYKYEMSKASRSPILLLWSCFAAFRSAVLSIFVSFFNHFKMTNYNLTIGIGNVHSKQFPFCVQRIEKRDPKNKYHFPKIQAWCL